MPNQPATIPLREGDRIRTLPCSGDHLTGRIIAVHKSDTRKYFRVQFPINSPYFGGCHDLGVTYREHEIERFNEPAAAATRLPSRPKSTKTQ